MFRWNNDFATTRQPGGSLRGVIKGLGGRSKRNCNYGRLLWERSIVFPSFLQLSNSFFELIISNNNNSNIIPELNRIFT